MHIPDSMLQGGICSVTATVSVVGIIAACYFGLKAKNKPTASQFGAVAALIFAGQMMNFPIMNGTSGHLLGGVLAASMLGTPFGVLAIALVVSIQSLLFSDGGITVLGANVFNMAILGAGAGGVLRSKLVEQWESTRGKYAATAIAAWLSVMLAAFAVSLELVVDGKIDFSSVVQAMLGTHALIGIGEVVITVAGCVLLSRNWSSAGANRGLVAVPLLTATIVALLLSPFASGFPDGLEWVAEKYKFLHESAPAFVGPFSDYAVPFFTNESLSTGMAGLVGVVVSFGAAWIIMKIIQTYTIEGKIAG